jgi:hypothetical protein
MIHLLTSRPRAAACLDLVREARALGICMRVGPLRHVANGDVVFAYGASRSLLASAASIPSLLVNGKIYAKSEQYERLTAAGIAVPRWRRVEGRLGPDDLRAFGCPAILKPDLGGFGVGVRLVEDPDHFRARDFRRRHLIQEFIPCGGRCARVVVLGDRVAWAIDRVARDGVVAAYSRGKKGWLEPVELTAEEIQLSIRAAQALGVEVAGVDLVRSARGPYVLEVNHRFVPFHLRAMYGDVPRQIAAYLESRRRTLAVQREPRRRPWKLPRAVGSWRNPHGAAVARAKST